MSVRSYFSWHLLFYYLTLLFISIAYSSIHHFHSLIQSCIHNMVNVCVCMDLCSFFFIFFHLSNARPWTWPLHKTRSVTKNLILNNPIVDVSVSVHFALRCIFQRVANIYDDSLVCSHHRSVENNIYICIWVWMRVLAILKFTLCVLYTPYKCLYVFNVCV